MKRSNFQVNQKKPELELNKPPEKKMWQKQGPFSLWYFIVMLILLYFFQSAIQIKREEIPYSQFQRYLEMGQVSECIVGDKTIYGTLKLIDPKTGKPRRFITVPLYNSDLANALQKHGVKYRVAVESHFFRDLLFNWVLPFAFIFLLWGFLFRKMGTAGMNFLNIGKNKARIHAESLPRVTFDDLVDMMVEHDLKVAEREAVGSTGGA